MLLTKLNWRLYTVLSLNPTDKRRQHPSQEVRVEPEVVVECNADMEHKQGCKNLRAGFVDFGECACEFFFRCLIEPRDEGEKRKWRKGHRDLPDDHWPCSRPSRLAA